MSETVNTNAIDIIRTAVSAVILILKKLSLIHQYLEIDLSQSEL